MKALVIGGSGVIGVGVVRHLLARGAEVTTYGRHRRDAVLPAAVTQVVGDRSDEVAFERTFGTSRYDVVIDLACFTPRDARGTVRVFGGRCAHLEFCSTVCTYGVKLPPEVLIDERFPQTPETDYARNKVACERIFERAAADGRFQLTILRPSHTYGPGGLLLDQLDLDGRAWDRVVRGLPILCAGDGLGLWQPTHRDDCGKLFAQAALNPKAYGQAYNATVSDVLTWRDYYRRSAAALETRALLVFAPAGWLLRALPDRFVFLREISQFHGCYSSAKARADFPEFRTTIPFEAGARETLADIRRRGAWHDSSADHAYHHLVARAEEAGFEVVEA